MTFELLNLIKENKATQAEKVFNNLLSLKLLEKINELKANLEIQEGEKKEFEFEGKTYKVKK